MSWTGRSPAWMRPSPRRRTSNVPELLKLAGILALIIVLLRLRWNLGLVLILAAGLCGWLFGRPAGDLALDALHATLDPLTLRLVAIVLLITFLGEILRSTLQLEGLIRSLGDLITDPRWLLPLMPMLIGLLPMVGGAMFSAPMVDEASRRLDIDPERRTFLNYWFRHALETVFPLYPSLVVAAGLMGVPAQALTVSQWPLFVAAMVGGALFGLLGIPAAPSSGDGRPGRRETLVLLLQSIWPIALVLILSVALKVDLILSLLVAIVLLVAVQRLQPRQLWDLARRTPLGIVPIIVGAMVFRRVLETSHAVELVSASLTSLGIPLAVIVFAAPFVPGLLTGLAVAAFAIGLPIVLPLVGPDIVGSGYGLLAYAGGLAGLMLSPMHLCLSLTRVYFRAQWGGIYRRLVPAVIVLAVTAGLVVWIKQ
jgi:integral membrane protein (TIGR00529 family)